MTVSPILVWFRSDLRLADNPALAAAAATGAPVIPLYIEDTACGRPLGGASRWWLHMSLLALDADLRARGSRLILRRGPAAEILPAVIAETGARTLYWNRLYDGPSRDRDSAIKAALKQRGLAVESFNAALLVEPWDITTKTGGPFRVFTPFWKALLARGEPPSPLPPPARLSAPADWPASDRLDDWRLLPTAPDWAGGLRAEWQVGEQAAASRLDAFLDEHLGFYPDLRDLPARAATSRLSPHLRFGEISPRQVWHRTRAHLHTHVHAHKGSDPAALGFLREIAWREFCYHLLFHSPDLAAANWNPKFREFPWRDDPAALAAWQQGRTGYPIVDAGMRELWTTGVMHNRVRMIAASFLIKDLLIDWRKGESWFWDTLVDADPASNPASWQWVAGTGADAAPYFRIFNPTLQSEKFDRAGDYIRRWLPELARLPDKLIHRPAEAPAAILRAAGITPGITYPHPLVDHAAARTRALIAYDRIKTP